MCDEITFETHNASSKILDSLYEQQRSNRFCDLTLYVNEKTIKVHRNVLACNSPYFDSILKQHKIVREQLTITCLDSDIFERFVTYLYTGKITINSTNVEELLRLANHFIIDKIIEYCQEFLEKSLNESNCLLFLDLVQKYNLKSIEQLDRIIALKLTDFIYGDELLNVSVQKLQNFVKYQGSNLPVIKALDIFTRWVRRDKINREKDFVKLLNSIEWINADHNDISKHLDICDLYQDSERCLYNILNALIQNNILLPNYKSRYEELHYKFTQSYNEINSMEMKSPEMKSENTDKEDENSLDNEKTDITVTEMQENQQLSRKNSFKMLVVKAKQKSFKQRFIRRLMLYGLKSNMKLATMKNVFGKKKLSVVNIQRKAEDTFNENSEKSGVKCPICFTVINDSLLLEQHLALSHSKDVTYKCGICTFVCQYHGDYLTHMKNHFTGPPFKCDYCEHNTDQISKLLTHRAQHSEEMMYQCSFCSYKCRIKQNLLTHLRVHANDRQFKCDSCDKTFRFRKTLEQHALTHETDKTMTCESCGFCTKYLSHMIAHKRMHTGDVYRCSFPHCKYSTAKKNQLTSHSKTHNGVRPHNCAVCGRGFMEKSHLVRHERIHLDEKPFKCSQCDYASSRRDKLKEHFTRHHGENASAKVPYKARPLRNNTPGTTTNNTNRSKTQSQESPSTTNSLNFTPPTNNSNNTPQPITNDIQELIMHHQTHPPPTPNPLTTLNTHNYHPFSDPTDFHHHHHHTPHNIPHQLLTGHGAAPRVGQHQNAAAGGTVNHHMLARGATHPATSTAAAVAAAMMLDPRFHHNGTVPYHPNSTPVSMAMAAVQSSQQMQTGQHAEYPPSLQNCMTLF